MASTFSGANLAIPGPEWVVAEMPPGYQNRVIDIQRMLADLEAMGQFGGLLYHVGPDLGRVVKNLFASMKIDAEVLPDHGGTVAVRLDAKRHLLLFPSAATSAVEKKSPEVAQIFQLLHEVADDADRVFIVTNTQPATRPAERKPAMTPEALAFLSKLGATHVNGSTLFAVWKMWLGDPTHARAQIDKLYGTPAGTFELSAVATR